jgi:microcompartment protein CcmL/EutN
MRSAPALAVLDFASIAVGAQATDALLKKAPLAWFRTGTVTHGRYLTLFGGTPAAVGEALEEALERGAASVLDSVYLADAHPRLAEALKGSRATRAGAPLAILEVETVSSIVLAAERALKGTAVELLEIRLADAGLAGKGLAVFAGDLHELEAAVELARSALRPGTGLAVEILPRPHDALARELGRGTSFAGCRVVELDGAEGS